MCVCVCCFGCRGVAKGLLERLKGSCCPHARSGCVKTHVQDMCLTVSCSGACGCVGLIALAERMSHV